ncbi:MAG TPA: nucleotidyltransferase family protein [Thermoplasmata archaeon]|nr:nucleotidyltransferase family protein [Thermoplasmata archaeon]
MIRPVRTGSGLGVGEIIEPKRRELLKALAAHRARNPRVFGSVARASASRRSDLDLLVDFDEGASAFDQFELASDLEQLFGRRVDVVEPDGLHWLVRPQVMFEAVSV